MSALAARPRERGVLRTMGMLIAVVLGGVAVFLVVVAHSQKQVQVGLLIGLWGVLLGSFALLGPRRGHARDDVMEDGDTSRASRRYDIERVSAERREHELQLEVMLRREMQRVMHKELSQLRSEIARLRTNLLDKVNGQLRLERIETTRVVSSDIEQLQQKVRRLASRNGPTPALEAVPTFSPATRVDSGARLNGPLPYVVGAPAAAGNGSYGGNGSPGGNGSLGGDRNGPGGTGLGSGPANLP